MKISEIFRSIQGESTFAGLPCTFIRLTGCNLKCSYCDTCYAQSGGRYLSVADILAEVSELGDELVEITGGEPLLQKETTELMSALEASGSMVLVETNGSLPLPEKLDRRQCRFIMDIKCPSSGESASVCWQNMKRLRKEDEVKFVIGNRDDFDWAIQVIAEHKLAAKTANLLFSPVAPQLLPADLAQWILKTHLQVRLQLQLHKIIWPQRDRGI